jgi:hypothetical protein
MINLVGVLLVAHFVNLVKEIPIIQDVKFVVIVAAEMLEMDL